MTCVLFFFSSRRRHTRFDCDWSSDVCSSDLLALSRESGVPSILARDRPACALSSRDGGHPLLRSRHSTITAGKPYHGPDGTTRRGGISRPAMGSAAGRRELSSAPWCVVPGGGFDVR